MSRSVLISIRPKWCELIASGKKTVEVRKTAPKLKPPFKCYIYETRGFERVGNDNLNCVVGGNGRGKVIGEFICDGIAEIKYEQYDAVDDAPDDGFYQWWGAPGDWPLQINNGACLTHEEWQAYLGKKGGYAWHISALKIYDEPKKLNDLHRDCSQCGYVNARFTNCDFIINRPPQSWCYVRCAP